MTLVIDGFTVSGTAAEITEFVRLYRTNHTNMTVDDYEIVQKIHDNK